MSSVSASGVEFKDKTVMLNRKVEGTPAKSKMDRTVELILDQINFDHDQHLKEFRKKKPYIFQEMKEWFYALQPSMKTNTFECKYYAEVSFKHTGLTFGKKIPTVTVPI